MAALKNLPQAPGVYRMVDAHGRNLYIGKAKNIAKRVKSYTVLHRLPHRLRRMVQQVSSVEFTITETELEALFLEANFIRKFSPPYNILLKGAQAHTYIIFTQHAFPLIKGQKTLDNTSAYFGPFLSFETLKNLLKGLHKAFLLRSCSDKFFAQRTRPCLQYHMKRCSAPCVGYITEEEYNKNVRDAIAFLKGKSAEVKKEWLKIMAEESLHEEYEKAARLRDRLQALEYVQNKQTIHDPQIKNADVLAAFFHEGITAIQLFCFRHGANYGADVFFFPETQAGEEEQVLTAFLQQFYDNISIPEKIFLSHTLSEGKILQDSLRASCKHTVTFFYPQKGKKRDIMNHAILNAKKALEVHIRKQIQPWKDLVLAFPFLHHHPRRVEIYDNSHLRGENAFSALVVATPEGFQKKEYRLFSMHHGEDDYAMMRDVIEKRFSKEYPVPDLLLIDGGKGHLSSVYETLARIGLSHIPIIAISKGPHRKNGEETFHTIHGTVSLQKYPAVFSLLQRLRDEAHRFAITHHRKSKRKGMFRTSLDILPGITPERKKSLLRHFSTPEKLFAATLEELQNVPSISVQMAKKLHDFFQNMT